MSKLASAIAALAVLAAGLLVGYQVGRRPVAVGPAAVSDPSRGDGADDAEAELTDLESLRSLPYALSAPTATRAGGVRLHEVERAQPGLNFYSSRIRDAAVLMDMEGETVHEWSHATEGSDGWQHAELLPDGDVLVLIKNLRLFRLDRDSAVRWSVEGPFHHDLDVDQDGSIHVLSRRIQPVPEVHGEAPTIVDTVVTFDADGKKQREISLLHCVLRSEFAFLLPSVHDSQYDLEADPDFTVDVLHANHVEVLDGRHEASLPAFRRGNLLVSFRTINTIAVVDPTAGRVVWAWGSNNLWRQHHPVMLDNGHVLAFDNGRTSSRVVEIDPAGYRMVWRYAPVEDFFSKLRGSVQRLPNGNTLITLSDPGTVLEVTPSFRVVWAFLNPDVNDDMERAAIWRMTRFDREDLAFLRD